MFTANKTAKFNLTQPGATSARAISAAMREIIDNAAR